MARGGINKVLVRRARDALLARGERPSIDAVRTELGNTGSKSTIQRYLKELSAEQRPPPSGVSLDEELLAYVSSLAERLIAHAQAAVAHEREQLAQQEARAAQQRQVEQARLEQLQEAHTLLNSERRDCLVREQALNSRLHEVDAERQRLAENERGLQRLLEERAAHIQSLEDKHRHAREALNHYRQQHLAQREQETRRSEEQLHQLQQELRRLQGQLLAKQEELGQVYRELERLNAALQARSLELRTQGEQLQQTQRYAKQLESDLQQQQERLHAVQIDASVAREKSRRYVLKHRQDRRDLRSQTQQLAALHTLIRQLRAERERTVEPPPDAG